MPNQNFIDKKKEILSKYIDELEPLVTGYSIAELRGDNTKYHTIERLFQLIVDTMIDINVYILREGHFGAADDLQSTFKLLGDFKVLDNVFANKIAPIVGARNMIVHRYEKLDMDLFLHNLKNNFSDFKTYIIQIDSFVKNN
ncbi:MAG: hypothetical protein A3G52_02565 [Candidatus Taylorbacteria bacterium RIFCSPLOWO2_12_FULL_43_20]|uniref:DUF86 domain-containing protein n=1 Tax=Candidatus Taylorbacteria bacterium RIFCSPLOWO2_12_FULL_43_20 TaxID=1802332 RepID=A0A1G2NZ56_9BACT|nr:MAG: hypothetical protein A2825_02610 [Candidatus Taylorbacteria bacterium RIFCSPHIGHO2_01_FULL_43_120]OHA41338.1 MAG: hypothetical protein A3G52_02565 [Candidatus Taylorbacteria bacterium RIFCSPLOWO2_12_FULL_43_20]